MIHRILRITTRDENIPPLKYSPFEVEGGQRSRRDRTGDVLTVSTQQDNPLKASPSFPLCLRGIFRKALYA